MKKIPLHVVKHESKEVIFQSLSVNFDIDFDKIIQEKGFSDYKIIFCKNYSEFKRIHEEEEQKSKLELLKIEEQKLKNPVKILELVDKINLVNAKKDFEDIENSIYIPIIGNSNVCTSISELRIKKHNYIQVCINEKKSKAIFLASFLNSKQGLNIRNLHKGGQIPKLSKARVSKMIISIPSQKQQKNILNFTRKIDEKNNELIFLTQSLDTLKKSLIKQPDQINTISKRYKELTKELDPENTALKLTFDEWIETLPFPLAATLRVYIATPKDDKHRRFRLLLHFFEATAPFISTIYFSIYINHKKHFDQIKSKFQENFPNFRQLGIGDWVQLINIFGKYTRTLLTEDSEECLRIFKDDDLFLAKTLSNKKIQHIFEEIRLIRNGDWAHTGITDKPLAEDLENKLLTLINYFRDQMGDIWSEIELIKGGSSENLSENNYIHNCQRLMGSHPAFKAISLKSKYMIFKDNLYLIDKKESEPIKLVEFLRINPPESKKVKNASYFFNGLKGKGESEFISHHHSHKIIENSSENLLTLLKKIM